MNFHLWLSLLDVISHRKIINQIHKNFLFIFFARSFGQLIQSIVNIVRQFPVWLYFYFIWKKTQMRFKALNLSFLSFFLYFYLFLRTPVWKGERNNLLLRYRRFNRFQCRQTHNTKGKRQKLNFFFLSLLSINSKIPLTNFPFSKNKKDINGKRGWGKKKEGKKKNQNERLFFFLNSLTRESR